VEAKTVLPKLEGLAESKAATSRATAVTALRYALSTNLDYLAVRQRIDKFLRLLLDDDLEVRRQAILTVNNIVRTQARWPHSHEIIQRDHLEKLILPALYEQTPPNPKLVVETDYGGFKQSIDQGLPVRRAAFQALESLLELVPHRLNMQAFIKAISYGLIATYGDGNHYDLQASTWQLFSKNLAVHHASSLCEWLDNLPDFVMDTIKAHMKVAKITVDAKTTIDPGRDPVKSNELLRTFIQAALVVKEVPGVDACQKFQYFVAQICMTQQFKGFLEELQKSK